MNTEEQEQTITEPAPEPITKIPHSITLKKNLADLADVYFNAMSLVASIADKIDLLAEEGIKAAVCGTSYIDFDYLPHNKVVRVLLTFPGKWTKEPASEGRINYILKYSAKLTIRCYQGNPPPNCQIIEVEEEVPAVPASIRKVKKLVCKEGSIE
jgi:hypothetical protein